MNSHQVSWHNLGLVAYGVDDCQFGYERNAVACTDQMYMDLEKVLMGNPKREVTVFGKTHHPTTGKRYTRPRHEATYGKDYIYSGLLIRKEECSNELVDMVMEHANMGRAEGAKFTWCLVNLYEHGMHSIGMHRDNEKDVKGGEVRTYSFGAIRKFIIREFVSKKRKREVSAGGAKAMRVVFSLEHGSCGIMKGEASQTKWEHGINQEKKIKGSRISITPRM